MELWLKWFIDGLNNFDLEIDEEKINRFKKYLDLIIFYNQKFNLTGEKTKEEIAIKQFLDSIVPIYYEKKNFNKSLDLGTGAGIPSIPLKIFLKEDEFFLIESNKKRFEFLNFVIKELDLKNVYILNGRGEELIKKEGLKEVLRENFDSVFARWVLKIPGIFELTAPFVKVGGKIYLWKGIDELEKIEKSKDFLSILGLEIFDIFKYELPYFKSERILLVLKKVKNTSDRFPRSFKKIKNLSQ